MGKRAEYYRYHDGDAYRNLPIEAVFEKIYRESAWNVQAGQESVSGPGSSREQTSHLLEQLPGIFEKYGILSILDIPCGDFNWMARLDWSERRCVAADILEELVESGRSKYASDSIAFERLDLIADPLPRADLVFCRDCLVHFSHQHIFAALDNARRSGSKYLFTTTFTDPEPNQDIVTGGWRPINLTNPPFDFPQPLELVNEHCTEAGGMFGDKSMGLWRLEDLPRK